MSVENLRIYREATEIAAEVSRWVSSWPRFDQWSLGMQIVRSAESISSNISEGYGRFGTGEMLQFLMIADASLQECKNQIGHALARKLIGEDDAKALKKRLSSLSISIVEFCNAKLKADPNYNGRFRQIIAKRRAWLLEHYKRRNKH